MVIPEIQKVKDVFKDANKLYNDILFRYVNMSSTKAELIRYNHSQLEKGIRSDGTKINPFYVSLKYKNRFNPVDLYLEGDFYKSFKVAVVKGNDVLLLIWASDFKAPFLKGDYGKEILGLTDGNVEKFAQNFVTYFTTELPKEIINTI